MPIKKYDWLKIKREYFKSDYTRIRNFLIVEKGFSQDQANYGGIRSKIKDWDKEKEKKMLKKLPKKGLLTDPLKTIGMGFDDVIEMKTEEELKESVKVAKNNLYRLLCLATESLLIQLQNGEITGLDVLKNSRGAIEYLGLFESVGKDVDYQPIDGQKTIKLQVISANKTGKTA